MESQHTPTARGPSVLTEPFFTVRSGDVDRQRSLAALLADLLTGSPVSGFPLVAAEQHGHWYRFLVRCGARACHAAGLDPRSAGHERSDLETALTETLTGAVGGSQAWCIHDSDPTAAAFLQPPSPEGLPFEKGYKPFTCSLLSCLIGSKNHERKIDVGRSLTPEGAAYALVEHQCGSIFGGRGRYASQLMGSASGKGSGTPFIGVMLPEGLSATFRHDVGLFLDRWSRVQNDHKMRGAVWALWSAPWDGISSLPASELDPAFIPMARMVRLAPPGPDGRYDTVWFRASKAARVADHTEGGDLGDPFLATVPDPKQPDRQKVRGTMDTGYDYREVVRLLFGIDARPAPVIRALRHGPVTLDARAVAVFEGVAYEQGKTGGFFRREVLLPVDTVRSFLEQPEPLHEVHAFMLLRVNEAKTAVRGAGRILLAGNAAPRHGDRDKVESAAALLEATVDSSYLDRLMEYARIRQSGDGDYQGNWVRWLHDQALDAFRKTQGEIPTPSAQRLQREITAEAWLRRRLKGIRVDVLGELWRPVADDAAGEPHTSEVEA